MKTRTVTYDYHHELPKKAVRLVIYADDGTILTDIDISRAVVPGTITVELE